MQRYKLEQVLGRGTSGIVYKAIDTVTGQIVAVKVFHKFAGFPFRELSIARKITHLNVCRIYEYIPEEDGSNVMAMECVDGGTLADLLKKGAVSWSSVAPMFEEILNGLEAIHAANIIHQDLKPANILLTLDKHVKLTDFGQARPIDPEDFATGNAPGGTAAYRAPELATGAPCDARADIYSFGIILAEILSGERPRPPAPLDLPAGIPRHVRSAIKRCVQMDRDKRFNSVSEVREALGLGVAPLRRSWGRTALISLTGIALILSAIYFFSFAGAVYNPPPVPSPQAVAIPPARQQKTMPRIAVLNFVNLSGDASLDPYTAGIAETVTAELTQASGLTIADRNRVLDTVHDIAISKQYPIPAAEAREIGKAIGVDALVTGSFDKAGTDVKLIARLVDPVTGNIVRSPAMAAGAFKDLFTLQNDLARQLAGIIQGAGTEKTQQTAPAGHSIEAFQAFSSGVYFLENDLPADALKSFDRALSIDAQYPAANHYRGLALAKLNRLDDAIDAFKLALPPFDPEKTVAWNWVPMYSDPVHGVILAGDTAPIHRQRDLFALRRPTSLQRAVYAERNGKSTALQFVDPEKNTFHQVDVADENILFGANAAGNNALTIIPAVDLKAPAAGRKIGLYVFSNDGRLAWHTELADFGNDIPMFAAIGGTVYVYYPALHRLDLLDGRTGDRLWRREGLAVDGIEAPWTANTKAYGGIFIFKSGDSYRAIRKSDGTDAWSVRVQSEKPSELLTDRGLVIFEPERRLFIVNLETGMTAGEIPIPQFVDSLRTPVGPKYLVSAMAQGNILYMMSQDRDFCAIDLVRAHILWRVPLQKTIQHIRVLGSRLYLGTAEGDVVQLDAATGAVVRTTHVGEKGVLLDHVGDDGLIVRSGNTLYSFTPDGIKNWEHAGVDTGPDLTFAGRAAVVYTSAVQIAAIDTDTGEQLWQYQGTKGLSVLARAGRVFVLDETGVKEYRMSAPANAVTGKDTLTELARAYLAKHDLSQARAFAAKASALDPDFPPLVLLQARLSQASGNAAESGRKLARYADLVGVDSKEGRRTIAELKRDHGLLWVSEIGADVAGDPVLMGNRLVSVGRKSAQDAEGVPLDRTIVGLDPETGAIAWRFVTERFTASVAVDGPHPYLYYAAGSQADLNSVFLYRVDVRNGERQQLAVWKGKKRIDQAWIASAAGRIFVAGVVPDIDAHTVEVFVDAFDAALGTRAWSHNQTLKIGSRDAGEPLRAFVARDNAVTYSAGRQTFTLRASDGMIQPAAKWPALHVDSHARQDLLWPFSTTLIDERRLFGFTAQGHAFAIKR